ncbi:MULTISPECIES: cytochrome P450 [unclassified Streptomyces]|uniref:cytochrome P450 n=1 Tax=unclassified Streptomyces TaxID=2593676 RepID=UPI000DDA900F|nr:MULTISPECIES: cytochrome P450 [unclassified Streptomyces]QZZ31312.1 cytochrome P450 [Streptomyces sp. ST1015]
MTDLTDIPTRRPPNEPLLLDPGFLADPAASFGVIREQGPVVRGWLTEMQPVWLVTRYDDVREGLRDHARFVHTPEKVDGHTGEDPRRVLVDMLNLPEEMRKYFLVSALDADPPAHTRLRGAVARTFTARRMQALRPRIAGITHDLLTEALANSVDGTLELVEGLAFPSALTAVCELAGVPAADRAAFRRWGDDILAMDPVRLGASSPPLIETITRLLDERRRAPGEDLLSGLARGLDEVEAAAMVMNVVMAGYDNTAQLLINSLAALLTHPGQLRLLRDDMTLMPRAVEEFVRWCGPDIVVRMRLAAEDVELHGVRVRKGDCVQFVLVSANRDPRRFPDGDRLDITRAGTEEHLGFGQGIHYCVGAGLSRVHCEVALGVLLERFPQLRLAGGPESLKRDVIPGTAPRLPELRVLV